MSGSPTYASVLFFSRIGINHNKVVIQKYDIYGGLRLRNIYAVFYPRNKKEQKYASLQAQRHNWWIRSLINMALTANFRDFEDAIQYSSAVLNHLDAIVTRNPRDFPVATPRIITPEELIQELTNTP